MGEGCVSPSPGIFRVQNTVCNYMYALRNRDGALVVVVCGGIFVIFSKRKESAAARERPSNGFKKKIIIRKNNNNNRDDNIEITRLNSTKLRKVRLRVAAMCCLRLQGSPPSNAFWK